MIGRGFLGTVVSVGINASEQQSCCFSDDINMTGESQEASAIQTISIHQVVGSPLCVASGDGQKVFERINHALAAGRRVNLSFENVTALTTAFLNPAIGQLYGKFAEDTIRSHIEIAHIEKHDLGLLVAVVRNAKTYFKNKERSDQVVRDDLGEDERTK